MRVIRQLHIAVYTVGLIATGAVLNLLAPTIGVSATAYYDWTLSGGGDTGSGVLETGAADGGGFDVLSFTGEIDGSAVALFGGQPGPVGAYTPGDYFYYDNILYPVSNPGTISCSGGPTVVDGCGIVFTINGGYANIWDNYTGTGTGPDIYSTTGTTNYDASFTIAPVPEPLALWLFGAGLIGAAAMRRRRNTDTAA
jgi:PEP-CTERM motif